MDHQEKTRAPAIDRCVGIMEYLQDNPPSTISEISKATGIPLSSMYVLADSMRVHGLLRQDENGRLHLWMKLISLGRSAAEKMDIGDLVRPALLSLMDAVDCLAVHYGIMNGSEAYYAIKIERPGSGMQIRSREGMSVSLVHAGLGKCLLAFQDADPRARIIDSLDFTKATPTSIGSPEELRKELATIRLQKWAFDNSEGESGIRCVAVPVFDKGGKLLGAVSIVGTITAFTDDKIPGIVALSKECSKNITNSL
ncbi:MAG: IclR family transcriptional regulator [Aeromonadales bacterium]|nr:IclR family transcriptional regulator [Aeromonadales bacterium]MDY2892003.1 IclR family transcriptional regulator [Succinivibrio sp.]